MHERHPPLPARLSKRRGTLAATSLVVTLALAPPALGQVRSVKPGEIQVSVVREPGAATRERIDERMPGGLSWEDSRQRLLAEGVKAPARPTQFALTPQQPWRKPGGYLAGNPERWHTSTGSAGAPTGFIQARGGRAVEIGLQELRSNTQYLLDLYVGFPSETLDVIGRCGFAVHSPVVATFYGTTGPQHLFLVLPTDSSGSSCVTLLWSGRAMFWRVDVTELGPVP